ncbi:MAG: sugar ABC transporter permease [Caldilineaceae bacterium]|uniref:Sugar ABC transporter permease n=1 Tax=Caldilineaceae bacterium SB0662_bin_9 TaxID=2605258 RepID=A0A6B1DS07_9CHLR|nr:sugar ABC transporter permease [Caldilineaceae bacterium]MXZ23653.1 sugar ABC transporter permease [Caldilineaceae bacterium SB0665_bin_21]MYA04518.1 sugar ABC transporter permease [Caldilineaceae bacterium SB0664_bin_22]MYC64008.1 sugar ABC transporter permease [Caldilineaceae bacterium SB0661_bin_34]MYD89462.1 sugar ABC transporter permease [Caldilineaceae bacterium SB0662_bin_9]
MSMRLREELEAYLFLLPWILGFLIFLVGPLAASLYFSLADYNILQPPKLVGLANYQTMFADDPLFLKSLRITAIYTFASVPLIVTLGYLVALLLNQKVRGLAVWRTIFYLPAVVSGVAVAVMWVWVFDPDGGIVNNLLRLVGIEGPAWFTDPDWALTTLILTSLWGIGGGMVVYLAGMQGVPTHLYEACELDGGGTWNRFRHVTLPMTTPVIFFNLLIGIIGSWQVFTNAFVITNGGPANATLFYVLFLYRQGWKYHKMGYASALAWVLFFIILIFTIVVFKTSGWVYYESDQADQSK